MDQIASFIFEHKEKLEDDFYVRIMNLLKEEKQKQKDLYETTILKPNLYYEEEEEIRISYDRYVYIIRLTEEQLEEIKTTYKIHWEVLGNNVCSPYSDLSKNNIRVKKVNDERTTEVECEDPYFLNEYFPVVNIKKVE